MMVRRIFLWMGLMVLFLPFFSYTSVEAQEIYKVKKGDTLMGIASKFNIDIETLRKINNLSGDTVRQNQILRLSLKDNKPVITKKRPTGTPTAAKVKTSSYVVKPGDTLISISRQTGTPVREIKLLNRIKDDKVVVGRRLALKKADKHQQEAAADPDNVRGTDQALQIDEEGDGEELLEEGWIALEREKRGASELLGKWNNPEEPQLLVRMTMGFLGAPYRFGGNSIRGIDCSAFVRLIYNIFGIELPRTAREQSHVGLLVPKEELEKGDLVFFNTRRALGHVGIYIGNNEFIHASYRKKSVRIDKMDAPYFSKRFVRAVRLKGMDENI